MDARQRKSISNSLDRLETRVKHLQEMEGESLVGGALVGLAAEMFFHLENIRRETEIVALPGEKESPAVSATVS